ncbi:MAG: hypothetical protein ABFD07_02945 [Methanobacterium sp.]
MRATAEYLRQKYPEAIARIKQSRTEPILTDADRAKIEHFVQRFKHPDKHRARVLQIIEMSADGFSVRDIRKEVGMGYSLVSETRMWSRREGLW